MNNEDIREGFKLICGQEDGILLLHGFTGTPYEMRPVGEFLYHKGFTVLCPKLAGHGTTEEDLNKCRFYDWINSAERALGTLSREVKNVHVLGLSMGGLIAIKLAAVHKEIKKLIVIASPFYLKGGNALFVNACRVPIFRMLVRAVKKPEPRDDRYKKIWSKNPSYRKVPTAASYEFYKLMQSAKKSIKDVRQSTMFIYSKSDRDVSIGNLSVMASMIGSRDVYILIVEKMGHLITLEDENIKVFEKIFEFIKQ
ncbi:MAG: alpha/beta fold hydrolase [Deltaproteobacteria bacterium]|nr:alpha/beta fold hydrolase [Deltaproteobacteria bacterium]